jgi:hypothetical protein
MYKDIKNASQLVDYIKKCFKKFCMHEHFVTIVI